VLQPLSLFGLYILQNLVHGKFSINCYSFNFMHESCLKGKMLVDQPPSCHHPLHLPSATTPPPPLKTTLTLTHQPSKNGTQKRGGISAHCCGNNWGIQKLLRPKRRLPCIRHPKIHSKRLLF